MTFYLHALSGVCLSLFCEFYSFDDFLEGVEDGLDGFSRLVSKDLSFDLVATIFFNLLRAGGVFFVSSASSKSLFETSFSYSSSVSSNDYVSDETTPPLLLSICMKHVFSILVGGTC